MCKRWDTLEERLKRFHAPPFVVIDLPATDHDVERVIGRTLTTYRIAERDGLISG